MGGASLSLEQTGALERRGLFSRFAGRLDGTPGDLSSPGNLNSNARTYRSGLRRQFASRWRCIGPCSSGQSPARGSGQSLRWAPPQGWGGEPSGVEVAGTNLVKTRECKLVVLGARHLCSHFLFLACRLRQIPGVAGGFRRAGFMAARLVRVTI
ncbi:hypothetical protein MRX96_053054 [Rhipicephalus microplus]